MIEVFNNTWYSPEVEAIFTTTSMPDRFATATQPVKVGEKIVVAPWGENNDLPQQIIAKSEASEVVSSNLQFNISSAYGVGVRPFIRDGDRLTECQDPDVVNFFEDNDVSGFFLEQVSDMMTFFNVFPQIILSEDGRKIVGLHHLEAAFSRWGSMVEGDTGITKHYYSSMWGGEKKPTETDIDISPVLSRYNTLGDLVDKAKDKRNRRFVLQVTMPTPGRLYYANAYWHSIFRSGWFDIACMIPKFKMALMKNNLTVRNIVYISESYWSKLLKQSNINESDAKAVENLKRDELDRIKTFLSNENGKGGTMVTSKSSFASNTGKVIDDKSIIIENVKSELSGGELVQDSEEASNIISYAMGVHPSLNGATPGKNSGSLGGSDKETLFAMKQAMMQPFRDRLFKTLILIKRYNKWDERLVFAVPEYNFFTTNTTSQDADK